MILYVLLLMVLKIYMEWLLSQWHNKSQKFLKKFNNLLNNKTMDKQDNFYFPSLEIWNKFSLMILLGRKKSRMGKKRLNKEIYIREMK